MTAQEYISSELKKLNQPAGFEKDPKDQELEEAIFKIVMSKKFRKYSVEEKYIEHIHQAIKLGIKNKQSIKFTFVFGGYKLWRLDESPEPDWAELFSMIYYANWLKSICEIYEPGVWFDFFSDDVIVPILNNIAPKDTKLYGERFTNLLSYTKSYLPQNFSLTYNRVGDQYDSDEQFKKELDSNIESLKDNLPTLTPELIATIDLNVKPKSGQEGNPKWHEKVQLLHDAYAQVSKRRPYYRTEDKIMVVPNPISNSIAVGTTKSSIMKFWIGIGALKQRGDNFYPVILSSRQLATTEFDWQDIKIAGLEGKNFNKIRILK
jgi:hypothetical protein